MTTTQDFLPNNYELPSKPYMKFVAGDNIFRILDSPITGYIYFNADNKPVRQREEFTELPDDIKYVNGKPQPIKHFWAMKVWNYKSGRVEILEITQNGIQKGILSLSKNPKWGSPLHYDICVTKTGEMLTTEYTVMPEPKSELTDEQARGQQDTYVNLDALYDNADPFTRV